jgi:hypothetical protein
MRYVGFYWDEYFTNNRHIFDNNIWLVRADRFQTFEADEDKMQDDIDEIKELLSEQTSYDAGSCQYTYPITIKMVGISHWPDFSIKFTNHLWDPRLAASKHQTAVRMANILIVLMTPLLHAPSVSGVLSAPFRAKGIPARARCGFAT